MGAEGESIQYLIPDFKIKHPGIEIKLQTIPWEAAHEKLLTAYAGKSTPDICQLGNTWIPEFYAIGALLKLDSLLAHSSVIQQDNYFDGIWDTNVIDNHILGIPWYVDTRLLFYRSNILDEAGYQNPPQTWAEWLDVSRKIKQLSTSQINRHAVFFSRISNDWQVPVLLILENNGHILKDNNCYAAFDDPATIEALRFYLTFFDEQLAIKSMTEVTNMYQGFSDGVFSMIVTGPWNIHEIRKRCPGLEHHWDTAPMPSKKNNNSVAGGSSLIIFKNSKHPEAAWQFIEYLSQVDVQLQFFKLTRDLPAIKKAWDDDLLRSDEKINSFYIQLQNVISTPKIPEWEQIAVKIQEHLETVIFKKSSLEDAVKNLNKDVDRILEKRRWLLARNL